MNIIQLMTYHTLGRWIVEVEQGGKNRAEYGKQVLKRLSERLNEEFGKGFSLSNLRNARQFYVTYKDRISQTLFVQFAIKKAKQCLANWRKPAFYNPVVSLSAAYED